MNDSIQNELEDILQGAELLYDEQSVLTAIEQMAEDITSELKSSNPLILSVMTGGMIPAGLLLSRLHFPLQMDYIHATRYRGETEGNELVWLKKPEFDVKDRTVLVIDDILDKGQTLRAIIDELNAMQAAKVLTAVLVEKDTEREADIASANFTGLTVPDRYVFGCGMDYKTWLRNSLAIYAVKDL